MFRRRHRMVGPGLNSLIAGLISVPLLSDLSKQNKIVWTNASRRQHDTQLLVNHSSSYPVRAQLPTHFISNPQTPSREHARPKEECWLDALRLERGRR